MDQARSTNALPTPATAATPGAAGRSTPEQTRTKDLLASSIVLGFVSIAWFGWALSGQRFVPALVVGMVLGVAAGIWAVVERRRAPGLGSHQLSPEANRVWNRWVLFELILIVAGGFVLTRLGVPQYLAAWTLAVVGVHFQPLARFYRLPSLSVLAVVCVVVALLAVLAGSAGWVTPMTVAGGLGGLAMLATSLVGTLTTRGGRSRTGPPRT